MPGNRNFLQGLNDLFIRARENAARQRARQEEQETPLGDQLPEVPSVTETPTGITSPGGATTEAGQAQEVVDAISEQSKAEFESAKGAKEEAVGLQEDIGSQVDETGRRIGELQGELGTAQEDLNADLDAAREGLAGMREEVSTEFDRLKTEFGEVSSAAFDRLNIKEAEAAAQVMKGRGAAMEAAVQGVQGNVNSQVARIMSDPNLTNSQKQSMVSQVKLAGAGSMASAVGQTILGFNELAADVATKFGEFTAQIESQIVSEQGAFGRAQGEAFTTATIASQEITGQLLGIQATSDAAYATAQGTLEGIRSQAEMGGNQLLLDNLPNLTEPVLNVTDAASAAMLLGNDLVTRQFERDSIKFQQGLTMRYLRSMVGTPQSRVADAFFGGLAEGGPAGGIVGGGVQLLEEIFNPSPMF